jgi:hypothetical protein
LACGAFRAPRLLEGKFKNQDFGIFHFAYGESGNAYDLFEIGESGKAEENETSVTDQTTTTLANETKTTRRT